VPQRSVARYKPQQPLKVFDEFGHDITRQKMTVDIRTTKKKSDENSSRCSDKWTTESKKQRIEFRENSGGEDLELIRQGFVGHVSDILSKNNRKRTSYWHSPQDDADH